MTTKQNQQLVSRESTEMQKGKVHILLKTCAVLAVGALLPVTHVMAAPISAPFLAVDINGYNAGGGQSIGPTAAGYQGWEAAEGLFLAPSIDWGNSGAAGLTNVFSTTEGNITVNLAGVAPDSVLIARNRGANTGALSDVTQDFVAAQRGLDGFGQHFIKLTLSGLTPGQQYEVTTFAREPFNGGIDSFQAWTDRAALGGSDGPGAWMNANIRPGAVYQPAAGGVNNPIPTLFRSPSRALIPLTLTPTRPPSSPQQTRAASLRCTVGPTLIPSQALRVRPSSTGSKSVSRLTSRCLSRRPWLCSAWA